MQNNLPIRGYGKLFINGEYVSSIYSKYHFVKIFQLVLMKLKSY